MNQAVADDWKQKISPSSHPYLTITGAFSPEQCQEIISLFGSFPAEPGLSQNREGYGVHPDTRQVTTTYIPREQNTAWVYKRMDEIFHEAGNYWKIDVRETIEDIKYLVYRESDHFSQWHMDIGQDYGSRRKLSMSIELCDSSEYEGGELRIFPADNRHVAGPSRRAGTAVVFPSFRFHRVTPVTRGIRYALVNWISGPPLR